MTTHSEPDFGYIFAPAERQNDPGHPRLMIYLLSKPSEQHFDPMHALIPVVTTNGDLETLKIGHPWQGQNNFHVVTGRIIMQDHKGKTAEAFSCGGELLIEGTESMTTCVIKSTAPILDLTVGDLIIEALAEEIEILRAEQRARWAENMDAYIQKVANLTPLDIYSACLNTLLEKFHHMPVVEGGSNENLVRLINSEVRYLQANLASAFPPRFIADLFA